MRIEVSIECDDQAFGTSLEDAGVESARILRLAATKLNAGGVQHGEFVVLDGKRTVATVTATKSRKWLREHAHEAVVA